MLHQLIHNNLKIWFKTINIILDY